MLKKAIIILGVMCICLGISIGFSNNSFALTTSLPTSDLVNTSNVTSNLNSLEDSLNLNINTGNLSKSSSLTTTPSTSSSSSTGVSYVSSLPEADLGFNNILNILLIVIGVLLLLLGIAIIIRLKK